MNLLGKGNNPNFWSDEVRVKDCYKKFRDEQHKNWQERCESATVPAAKYSTYKLFGITGNRKQFESAYFNKRVQLECSTFMSLMYPEEPKYINFLMDVIFAVCDEYSWVLPAHQKELLVKSDRRQLDLFSCETGFTLAQIYTLLGERLEPLIRRRIEAEIDDRIITSYLEVMENPKSYWWMTGTLNWAAVCAGSVGCTFMLMRPELFEKVRPYVDRTMDFYLKGFGDDGFCEEGTGYWDYGFGFFCAYFQMLHIFTDGKCNVFESEKIKNIATFLQKMYLSGKCSVSFSDSNRTLSYRLGLLHLLKGKYPDDVKVYSPEYSFIGDSCARFHMAMWAATELIEEVYYNPEADNSSSEYFSSCLGWFVKRNENYGFAATAGNNSTHHNHNDIGSFIFAKGGKQLICDYGSGVYTRQYFAVNTRYKETECAPMYHSVPFFGENVQCFGDKYIAKDVTHTDGNFTFDMSEAYEIPELKSLVREFTATSESVTMTDTFDYCGTEPITERLTTLEEPKIENGAIILCDATVTYDESKCKVSVSTFTTSHGNTLYLIDFTLNEGVRTFKIEMK